MKVHLYILAFMIIPMGCNHAHRDSAYTEKEKADSLRAYGARQSDSGKVEVAHDCFIRAIGIYGNLLQEVREGRTEGEGLDEYNLNRLISLCNYHMAINYHNMRDTSGLDRIIGQMAVQRREYPDNMDIAYDYSSVMMARFLAEYEDSGRESDRDSMLYYAKASARAGEHIPKELYREHEIQPVWAWYNIAVMYDLYFTPPVTDSIRTYLSKAEEAAGFFSEDETERKESMISILDLKAWLLFYDGKYSEAEMMMENVLALTDEVEKERPNHVVTEKGQAYEFMVMLNENRGAYAKALEWQKLASDYDRKRFDQDLAARLHDISEKYETEKRLDEIEDLRERNRAKTGIIAVTSTLLTALFIIFVLYRRNARHRYYEAALEADARMEELRREMEGKSAAAEKNIEILRDRLIGDFSSLPDSSGVRDKAIKALKATDAAKTAAIVESAPKQLSAIDKKYIICFMAGLNAEEIARLFNIETESVYTVRYRIRKKFGGRDILP